MALITMIGLPGSGKSTTCSQIMEIVKEKCPNLHVILVSFDQIISLEMQQMFATMDEVDWNMKSERQKIWNEVDSMLTEFLTKSKNGTEDEILNSSRVETDGDGASASVDLSIRSVVVLLDDNFYYRSMRYEYFQLAKKHAVGFGQIYIECSVDEAVLRNTKRDNSVPNEVIHKINEKIQPPSPEKNNWEKNTLFKHLCENIDTSLFIGFISQCLMSPISVSVMATDAEEANIARQQCSSSFLHQADIILRVEVAREIQEAAALGKPNMKELAHQVNLKRHCLLSKLKKGDLALPSQLINVTADNKVQFETFLFEKFQNLYSDSSQ